MATQTIKYKKTTQKRQKKTGSGTGYVKCPTCGGTGRVKKR